VSADELSPNYNRVEEKCFKMAWEQMGTEEGGTVMMGIDAKQGYSSFGFYIGFPCLDIHSTKQDACRVDT
jgi:hypothetical protein